MRIENKQIRYMYICNAFEPLVKHQRRIVTDVPAATNKVYRLCRAVHTSGSDIIIVSLGRGRCKGTWRWYSPTKRMEDGVPYFYAGFWDVPALTHLVSLISMGFLIYRLRAQKSALIFYNHQFHYLLALILGRFMGAVCILDLEDGFNRDERGPRAIMQRVLFSIYNLLCNGGVTLASSMLKEQTILKPQYVWYGVAPIVNCNRNWRERPLMVLFGGALFNETGVGLLLQTIELLWRNNPSLFDQMRFTVTGFGDMSEAVSRVASKYPREALVFRGKVDDQEYQSLLRKAHVGLCLKLPNTGMGATTFPSKVVELASYGLLIISTRVSDVPLVLPEGTSILLEEATPQKLASALLRIVSDPQEAEEIALNGQKRVRECFSPEKVSSELVSFWNYALN